MNNQITHIFEDPYELFEYLEQNNTHYIQHMSATIDSKNKHVTIVLFGVNENINATAKELS